MCLQGQCGHNYKKKNYREKTVLFDQSRGESTYYAWREYSLKAL